MKYITLLNRFFKGAKLSALILSIVMLLALFMCVKVYVEVDMESKQFQALNGKNRENTVFFQVFSGADKNIKDAPTVAEILTRLEAEPRVKRVYTVMEPKYSLYGKKGVTLLLYTPEMMELLPGLKNLGIDFRKNPDGCVIIGYEEQMGHLQEGDTLDIKMDTGDAIRIPIVGRELTGQFLKLNLSSNTQILPKHLLVEGDAVIMLATENTMNKIVANASRKGYNRNMFVEFQDGVTEGERSEILSKAAPHYLTKLLTLDDISDAAWDKLQEKLGKNLPLPLFLLCSSLMAYLSIVILTFKRREKDLAMFYLCGGSKKTCAGITFVTFNIIALVPILLTVAAIIIWDIKNINTEIHHLYSQYTRQAILDGTHFTKMQEIYPGLKGFLLNAFGTGFDMIVNSLIVLEFDSGCLWIVLGFYGITALVAFLVTWLSMRKHSPLTYLRGVNE